MIHDIKDAGRNGMLALRLSNPKLLINVKLCAKCDHRNPGPPGNGRTRADNTWVFSGSCPRRGATCRGEMIPASKTAEKVCDCLPDVRTQVVERSGILSSRWSGYRVNDELNANIIKLLYFHPYRHSQELSSMQLGASRE